MHILYIFTYSVPFFKFHYLSRNNKQTDNFTKKGLLTTISLLGFTPPTLPYPEKLRRRLYTARGNLMKHK